MSEFYNLIQSLDLFELFEKIQNNIFYIIELQKFDLKIPLCIENEQSILKFYLMEKWLDDFPKQSLILKFIQEEKKLFYLPESADFYYLYYHLLIACKDYLETGKKIYDDKTQINYYSLNDELIEKKLNATKFFMIYLEKGSNFTDEDFYLAKKTKDELNEQFNFNSSKMTSESVEYSAAEKIEPSKIISEPTEFSAVTKTESDEFVSLLDESESEIIKKGSQIEIEVEELNLDEEVNFQSFV